MSYSYLNRYLTVESTAREERIAMASVETPDDDEPSALDAAHLPTGSRRADLFAERMRHAFLLHMWAEPRRGEQAPVWRFSLEEVETGVRHGFGSLDALVDFLHARMAS
jgi:hypothetical protein